MKKIRVSLNKQGDKKTTTAVIYFLNKVLYYCNNDTN